ncbi:type IV secretion system protein TraC [Cupriavidus sp. SW-Y-13]|uniref:type IV secretion system protein TraC n=1 Tax=Cupriavidus sp. SW-Y-13 TaxID=2653854 RepID=UPI00136566A4|nr:type IV secretion system protein TraC [Cupriavidus sp. SW-Y-13]MWL91854.1 type IV secretion system protein TraC [Cupriavidus sp. SW-Y-13]
MLGSQKSKGSKSTPTIDGDRDNVPYAKLTVRAWDPDTNLLLASDKGEHYLGACFIADPLKGADDATVDKFRSALSMPFPAGTFIQIGLLSSPDADEFFDAYMAGKDTENEVLRALAEQHASYVRNGRHEPLVTRSGVLVNRQRLILTIKTPCARALPSAADIAAARETVDRVQEAFKAAELQTVQLDAQGYLVLLRLIASMYEHPSFHYDETRPIREQVFFPGDSINYDDPKLINFNDGAHFAKVMSVKHFPKRASLAIMNHMIGDPLGLSNQITDPYYMVLTLHYPDQVKKVDWVKSRSSMLNHQVFGPTAHLIPALGYKKHGMDVLVHDIEGKGSIVCEANFTLFLFSRSKEKLNKLAAGLRAYYTSLAFEIREDSRILEPLWNNLLPLNTSLEGIQNLFRFHTMGVTHAVQFMPVIGEWTGSGRNGALLLVTRRGQPALIDLYESATNYNGIAFAEAGAGKSFLTQKIVSDYLAEGAKVWAIDAGRSYFKLCKAAKGSFVEFKADSDLCLNPFTFIDNLEEEMDIIKAMIAKMAAPDEALGAYAMSRLEEAITSVYQKYGRNASVKAVAEFCLQQPDEDTQRLGRQLYPFAGGAYTRWFEGENNLDMNNAFVVLELSDLKGRKALQQVVLLQLMSRINYDMFLTRGRKKILIIDEAWELLDDPVMGKAMEALYRKARKEKGAVLIVTQSIEDLYNSPNARAIAANSAWQFILKQNSESIDGAIAGGHFKIEPYGAHMLKTVHTIPGKYSEVMVKQSESQWGIFRLTVDRFTQVLFSTKDDERDTIFDAIDRGDSVVEAVHRFIDQEAAAAEDALLAA